MRLAIIDYGAGNTRSVQYALDRIGCESVLTDDPEILRAADGVIFPGVGHAKHAMKVLHEKDLVAVIRSLKKPVLGICLGMQLLAVKSEEGDVNGLGIIENEVKKFQAGLTVPHMGWNKINHPGSALFENIDKEAYFYFVHSYYLPLGEDTTAWTNYGMKFTACLQKDNFYACQFHPEKSGKAGEQLLKNFIRICE